jgi:hypothetical protein
MLASGSELTGSSCAPSPLGHPVGLSGARLVLTVAVETAAANPAPPRWPAMLNWAGVLLLVLVLERELELGTEGNRAILADLQVLLDHFGDAQVP